MDTIYWFVQLPRYRDDITPHSGSAGAQTTRRDRAAGASTRFMDGGEDLDFEVNPLITLAELEEPLYDRPDKSEPMIFICATMWHETEKEMIQVMKSIIR